MAQNRIKYIFTYYLPALLWMAVIFYLSSFHDLRTGTDLVIGEIILRKLAHAAEFAILAYLIFRILNGAHGVNDRSSFWWSLGLTGLYAVSDEFHQMFVAGREAKAFDVFIDIIGSYIGLYLIVGAKRKIHSWKYFLLILIIFFTLIAGKTWESVQTYGLYIEKNDPETVETSIQAKPVEETEGNSETDNVIVAPEDGEFPVDNKEKSIPEANQPLPEKVIANVPFTTQAPYSNWDARHEEACEEASLIMIKYFLDGKSLSKETAEREIQDIMDYELKNNGDDTDSTTAEIVQLADDYYGIKNLKVVYDFQPDDIKKYLSLKKPIIIPAAGRSLGNPNFTPPGPLYHMLVLTGYDGNTIITNDPGTRKGQNYTYDINTLYAAIHDFPGDKDKINQGRKAMIVIE